MSDSPGFRTKASDGLQNAAIRAAPSADLNEVA